MAPEDKEFIRDEFEKFGGIVKSGFDAVDERFNEINIKFNKVDAILKVFSTRFDKIDADTADIKRAIGPILQMMAAQDREIESIKFRLDRLEHQLV